jgi:hypothetical protein
MKCGYLHDRCSETQAAPSETAGGLNRFRLTFSALFSRLDRLGNPPQEINLTENHF